MGVRKELTKVRIGFQLRRWGYRPRTMDTLSLIVEEEKSFEMGLSYDDAKVIADGGTPDEFAAHLEDSVTKIASAPIGSSILMQMRRDIKELLGS